MEKRIGTYLIVCGLLSGSAVIFGMNPQHQASSTSTQSTSASSQATHGHHFSDFVKKVETDVENINKEIVTDFEKGVNIVHPEVPVIVQKGEGLIQQHPEIMAAVLNTIGVKQPQEQQNIINTVEKDAGIVGNVVENVDNAMYNLAQKLEEVQIAKNAHSNVVDAAAKK